MDIFQWLKDNEYDYTWNVKIDSGTPDIVGFNTREIVVFEMKKTATEVTRGIAQCLRYLKKINRVYVVIPSETVKNLPKSLFQKLQKKGIGLIEANDKIKILSNAKNFGDVNKKLLEQLREKSLSKSSNGNDVKTKITELLSQHPEGLSITEIAKFLGIHRHTAIKYIDQLLSTETVYIRKIGPVKLCYLKEGNKNER